MELIQYIRLFRKWFWLIFLAAFLGGGVSFLARSGQPATYEAQVTVAIGSFIESPNPSAGEISTGEKLAQTYAVLTKTYDVLQATVEAGDFPLTPDQLRATLNTRILANTSLLVLSVTYTDPILAADMANEVAQQLILNSPTNLTPEQQNQIDLAEAETAKLNEQLQETRRQLDLIDNQLESAVSRSEIERLTAQRNVLIEQINLSSSTIAQFSSTIADLQRRTNSLDIVERARIPTEPSGSGVLSTTILGAIVGAALAVGVALLVEYLDDTINTAEEATEMLALPVLGTITRFGKPGDGLAKRLITHQDPSAAASEGYRALRTNLLFSSGDSAKRAFIITSPGPIEGKTVTAANLAVVMAASGLRVLLVDADLRRPRIHEVFGLENKLGLTTLLSANPTATSAEEDEEEDLGQCLQDTTIPGLRVITSGFLPSNPTEVLGSALMQRWYNVFLSSKNVDVVLFDTPPSLFMADSSILAATINAPVVLVLEAGRTRRGAALKAKEQFMQLNVDVQGIVLNFIDPGSEGYGYGYGYYYYRHYYGGSDSRSPEQRDGWRRFWVRKDKEKEAS